MTGHPRPGGTPAYRQCLGLLQVTRGPAPSLRGGGGGGGTAIDLGTCAESGGEAAARPWPGPCGVILLPRAYP